MQGFEFEAAHFPTDEHVWTFWKVSVYLGDSKEADFISLRRKIKVSLTIKEIFIFSKRLIWSKIGWSNKTFPLIGRRISELKLRESKM